MSDALLIDLGLLAMLLTSLALAARLRVASTVPPALREEPDEDAGLSKGGRSRFELLALQAGLRPGIVWPFRVAQALLALGLVFGVLLLPPAPAGLPLGAQLLAALLVGLLVPEIWIRLRRRRRRRRIEAALSFLLDLVVALLAAGLTLGEALRRAGRHGASPGHPLGEETLRLGQDLDGGREPAEAFRDFADRTGVPAARAVAAALIVALRHGTSVESALTTQAELVRARERERMRRSLMTAATKAVFPLFLCGFPVLLVLALFPAVVELLESFRELLPLF